MDKKLFQEKLSQVAEWHIPKVTDVKLPKRKGRPSSCDIAEQEAAVEWLEKSQGINDTLPVEILKIKHQERACEYCDKVCEKAAHIETKQYFNSNKKYWRSRCMTCGLYENPLTGKFDLTGTQATQQWNNRMRYTKMAYRSKYNLMKQSESQEEKS
jgi:hypothetical protein